jgi:Glycosyl hydrolases family 16
VSSSQVVRRAAACAAALLLTGALPAVPAEADHAGPEPGPVNAANTYGWFPMKWEEQWHGDNSFRPWRRHITGSGTAYIRWEMIVLDSSVDRYKYPSRGSVIATLNRRGERYGRWEMRLRAPVWYDDGRDYKVLAQLIPANPNLRRCRARNIALASFTAGGSQVSVFARNAGKQWTHTKRRIQLGGRAWHTYAVEVTPRRISWFIDAHVVSTLRNPRAISDVRLTPRLTLRGVPGAQMDRARISVDWVRHFTLENPNQKPVRAPAPTVRAYRGC